MTALTRNDTLRQHIRSQRREVQKSPTVVVAQAWARKYRKQQTQTACDVMGLSASGYFMHWRRKNASKRISDEALVVRGTPTEAHILK